MCSKLKTCGDVVGFFAHVLVAGVYVPPAAIVGHRPGSAGGAQRPAADLEAVQSLHGDANREATEGQRRAGQVPRQGQQDERAAR